MSEFDDSRVTMGFGTGIGNKVGGYDPAALAVAF